MNLLLTAAAILAAAWLLALGARRAGAPPLLGMIAGGTLAAHLMPEQPLPLAYGTLAVADVAPAVRKAVLAVVLLRAGLSLSREQLRQAGGLALRLGLIPLLGDAALLTAAGVWLLELPLAPALVLGCTLAAISPAIVIPGLLELIGKRPASHRRVPTALLAGAPIDNIACIAALGVALDLAGGAGSAEGGITATLLRLPWSLVGSVVVGLLAGLLVSWLVGRLRGARVHMLLLFVAALLLIMASEQLGLSYVLAIISLGATVRARHDSVEAVDKELERVWAVVQYALFGLIGAALDLRPLAQAGLLLAAVIGLGQVGRAVSSMVATARSGLTLRERGACVLCYVPKATIQAAFGSAALDQGLAQGTLILTAAVLAVAICAPVGTVTLHRVADRLLPGAQPPSPDS